MHYDLLVSNEVTLEEYCKYVDEVVIPSKKHIPWLNRKFVSNEAGIYLIYNSNEEIVYIGETSNIFERLTHHKNGNGSALRIKIEDYTNEDSFDYLRKCTIKAVPMKLGRVEVEKYLINKYNPVFNNYNLRKRYSTNVS